MALAGDIFAKLDHMRDTLVPQGAVAGLDDGAAELQAADQATTAYRGVTGATRAGSVAYVAFSGVASGGQFDAAVAAVVDHNPDHVEVTSIPGNDDEVVVVLTTPTDYAVKLEIEHAGARAHLGPTFDAHSQNLTRAAAEGIARVLR